MRSEWSRENSTDDRFGEVASSRKVLSFTLTFFVLRGKTLATSSLKMFTNRHRRAEVCCLLCYNLDLLFCKYRYKFHNKRHK